jgi:branched-subunit amino acid transport protein
MSRLAAFWLVIGVLAVGTWAMRSLPIMLHGTVPAPRWAKRLLRYVPVAALTALVIPSVLYVKTAAHYEAAPARLLAAAVALLVAWRTRSVVATLVCGMIALWAAQAALATLA